MGGGGGGGAALVLASLSEGKRKYQNEFRLTTTNTPHNSLPLTSTRTSGFFLFIFVLSACFYCSV